jgi:hypothetical protein
MAAAMASRARPERPERPERPPPPPPPAYPASMPEISAHLYGLNWDLTRSTTAALMQEFRDALAAQFILVFPHGSVDLAFRTDYPGAMGPIPSLSVGVWSTPTPAAAAARTARIAGLLAARTPGMESGSGEISVEESLIITTISRQIPSRITSDDITATLRSALIAEVAPTGFAITASYDTDVPVFRPQPTCTSRVMFSAAGGSVQIKVDPVDCGDFGLHESLLVRFEGYSLALEALFALAYNAYSGLLSIPPIGLPPTLGNLFPREVPAGSLKFSLTYGNPRFSGGGGIQRSLRFPFNWPQPVTRSPSVVIRGPLSVKLNADVTPPATTATFFAVTTDLVAPTFQWKLGAQDVDGGAIAQIALTAPGAHPSVQRTFHVSVTALDGIANPLGSQLQASAAIDVVGTVQHFPGFGG